MPLVAGRYPMKNPNWLLGGSLATMWRENFPRVNINTDLAALTTQIMTAVAIPLQAGDVVTSLSFKSGATAAGTPTNWWFALYDTSATPALIAQTADQTSGAWAANTLKTLALTTAYAVPAPGVYYAACMVKATTVPTLIGFTTFAGANGVLATDKAFAVTSGSALTTTAPATLATPTNAAVTPYCVAT